MQTPRVLVVPYDEKWKEDFEKIKRELDDTLNTLNINHRVSKRCVKYVD